MLGSTVALSDDFVEMVVFSAMLGSASVYGCFWKNLVFLRDCERSRFALGNQNIISTSSSHDVGDGFLP